MKAEETAIINRINLLCQNFKTRSDSENLNELLTLFDKLYPEWVDMYNERDEQTYGDTSDEVEEMLITKLPENTSIGKYKVIVDDERDSTNKKLEKKVRILHTANKAAHGVAFLMKEYLYYFANQEIASGKLDFENIMKFQNDTDGNVYSVTDEKFFSDFLINYPFDLDFTNDDVKGYFETYTSADESIKGITSKIKDTRKRIAEIESMLTEEQEIWDSSSVDTEMLKNYLDKLRLKRRLESQEYLSIQDTNTLDGLCADRVALTNFIPEELVEEAEKLQLSIYDMYDQSDLLKVQKKDAADRAEAKLGRPVDVAFSKLSRLRLKYDMSASSIVALSGLGFAEAKKAYSDVMDIKNKMVANIHEFIQDNHMNYISYGISAELESKDKEEKNVFLIDLPGYSQVSVHFMPPVVKQELGDREYLPDYDMILSNEGRREQVVLINENTRAFRRFRRNISEDGTIDRKMGFDTETRLSVSKRANYRKLYGILTLDIGDDQDEREFWNPRIGKGKSYEEFTDKQKVSVKKKILEARDRRRAARHQLGVMMGLPKNLLEIIYEYEGKEFSQECRYDVDSLKTVKERNEVRVQKVFDKLLGRNRRQNQNKDNSGTEPLNRKSKRQDDGFDFVD